MTPELSFLLQCCRSTLDTNHADAARTLAMTAVTWPRLTQLANVHGLEPLLHRHLMRNEALAAAVPNAVRAQWQQAARHNAAHALMLADEVRTVLQTLAAHGIPAMPYKGVVLGAQLYGDDGVRVSGDIDVIVPKHRRMEAVNALRTMRGYQPLYAFHSPRQEAQYIRNIHHYNLRHPSRSIMVEVHWDATGHADIFAPCWADIWARSTAADWLGAPMQRPSQDDLFLLLALHGSKHQWTQLKWLADIGALTAATPEMDWPLLEGRAEKWRISHSLQLTRTLLTRLLGSAVGETTTSPLFPQIVAQLEAGQEPEPADRIRYIMQLHDRPTQRMLYAARLLFTLNFQDFHTEETTPATAHIRRPARILRKRGRSFVTQLGQAIIEGAFRR